MQVNYRLIQKLNHAKGNEPIISNEYVWGPNHAKIARAVASLEFDQRQTLQETIDILQSHQGYPKEKLPQIDEDLLKIAKSIGMISPTTIRTNRGLEKEFDFSSDFLRSSQYEDDILDDVKLMVASIRFGQNYTLHSRITDPKKFLSYFINNRKIGPHSANGTDYTLLEQRGIVKVERSAGNKFYMHLLRSDVAEQALKVFDSTQFTMDLESQLKADSLAEYGTFKSPEECRLELAKSPEHVAEAMEHLTRVLRDDNL